MTRKPTPSLKAPRLVTIVAAAAAVLMKARVTLNLAYHAGYRHDMELAALHAQTTYRCIVHDIPEILGNVVITMLNHMNIHVRHVKLTQAQLTNATGLTDQDHVVMQEPIPWMKDQLYTVHIQEHHDDVPTPTPQLEPHQRKPQGMKTHEDQLSSTTTINHLPNHRHHLHPQANQHHLAQHVCNHHPYPTNAYRIGANLMCKPV